MQVRKQQLKLDMEQQTDPKLGKEYVKVVYCHPAYLTYMQSTSCKMPVWMKPGIKLPTFVGSQRKQRTKELLDESERRECKTWLKAQHSENSDHGIQSHHFMANRWENMEAVRDFISLGFKITADGDCSHEIKTLAPWKKSYDQSRQHIKKHRHYIANKGPYSQSYGFPVVTYGCESWTIKKTECRRIDAFELWCWRRLLRVP